MVKRLTFFILFFIGVNAAHAKLNAYLAAKMNYAGIGAARIGFDSWELGLFSYNSYALNKKFRLSNTYYTTLGAGVAGNGDPAFVAGFGFNTEVFLRFGIRGELYAVQGVTGYSQGAGLLGASWNF